MKRMIALIFCTLLTLTVSVAASANEHLPVFLDNSAVLTSEECAELRSKAINIAEDYEMAVVVMIIDFKLPEDINNFAEDYYLNLGYGYGDDNTGLILILNTFTREWSIRTFGEARDAISDSECDSIMESASSLAVDDYYSGLNEILSGIRYEIYAYREVTPAELTTYIVIALGVGLLAGFITIMVMRSTMKTDVYQRNASKYIAGGTYHLHKNSDIYLYSNITKVRRSSDSSSSGRGSSGRSGGSSGRF